MRPLGAHTNAVGTVKKYVTAETEVSVWKQRQGSPGTRGGGGRFPGEAVGHSGTIPGGSERCALEGSLWTQINDYRSDTAHAAL